MWCLILRAFPADVIHHDTTMCMCGIPVIIVHTSGRMTLHLLKSLAISLEMQIQDSWSILKNQSDKHGIGG